MSIAVHIVVCAGIVPDPLQTLEPVLAANTPGLKNEMMLPHIIDPWAGHALFEAANLAANNQDTRVWLLSIGPKAKLQQVMMTIAQKVPFELVAVDAPAGGFTESFEIAELLTEAINGIQGLDKEKMLLFGGWESASRGAGSTMQILGEKLGITDQFQGVDEIVFDDNESGSFKILERVEGGKHQVSVCAGTPAVLGWATGNLSEPPNNPQVGMQNMRLVMPALQKAKNTALKSEGLTYTKLDVPSQRRDTKIVKDAPVEEIAKEIAAWLKQG